MRENQTGDTDDIAFDVLMQRILPKKDGLIHIGGDFAEKMIENVRMDERPTHREINAKLETIEARMDGRLARIEDAVKRIAEDNQKAAASFTASSAATQEKVSSLKTTIVVTGIGAVLTIVLGIAAFNATLLSNMTSSFDSGRETSKLASEAQTKALQAQQETAASLSEIKQIVSDLRKQTSVPAADQTAPPLK